MNPLDTRISIYFMLYTIFTTFIFLFSVNSAFFYALVVYIISFIVLFFVYNDLRGFLNKYFSVERIYLHDLKKPQESYI